MADGLLSGVLPFIYSQSDRLKNRLSAVLADPMGSIEQTAGQIQDNGRDQSALMQAAFADPKRPFAVTDQNAMMAAAQNMMNGPLGMAPAGITVYHGSPHTFDAFDSSKIGTGEGAQVYGHGIYTAENPATAKYYGDVLSREKTSHPMLDGKPIDSITLDDLSRKVGDHAGLAAYAMQSNAGSKDAALSFLKSTGDQNAVDWFQRNVARFQEAAPTNNFYKADLPDSAVAKMLDWDKPLSQQPQAVRDAFVKADPTGVIDAKPALDSMGRPTEEMGAEGSFKYLQNVLGKGKAEEVLRQAGIPGIRYLDGGSRGPRPAYNGDPAYLHGANSFKDAGYSVDDAIAGMAKAYKTADPATLRAAVNESYDVPLPQTSNFVVFPGQENLLSILERNGQPLTSQLKRPQK